MRDKVERSTSEIKGKVGTTKGEKEKKAKGKDKDRAGEDGVREGEQTSFLSLEAGELPEVGAGTTSKRGLKLNKVSGALSVRPVHKTKADSSLLHHPSCSATSLPRTCTIKRRNKRSPRRLRRSIARTTITRPRRRSRASRPIRPTVLQPRYSTSSVTERHPYLIGFGGWTSDSRYTIHDMTRLASSRSSSQGRRDVELASPTLLPYLSLLCRVPKTR